MTEKFKLVYFNLRAVAEPIRMIFAFKEIPYEDERINPAEWTARRKDYKWGQVPELHINGDTMISQSTGISRYLARKYDLMPSDNLEAARCDEIVDAIHDLRTKMKPFTFSKYFLKDGKDEEIKQGLLQTEFPRFLSNINNVVVECQKASGTSKGHFILGSRVSWADFWLAHFTSSWEENLAEPELLTEFSALKLQQEAVFGLDAIKKWVEVRPKTDV